MTATAWHASELDRVDAADELQIAPARPDGTLRPATNDAVDAAYYVKYEQYADYVPPMVAPQARATTLRLVPEETR